jgi:DNA-binding CsgD family transcriptional regulator
MVRALHIRSRLTRENLETRAALDAVERSHTATIVVLREGVVIQANREAKALLGAGDAIRSVQGQLVTSSKSAIETLTARIRDAIDAVSGNGGSAGGTVLIERDKRLPLTILVAPFRLPRPSGAPASPAAILFLRDPERISPESAALQSLFGLTPAQAPIVIHLARGRSIQAIAARHSLSLNTVRTHLKKTLRRQEPAGRQN